MNRTGFTEVWFPCIRFFIISKLLTFFGFWIPYLVELKKYTNEIGANYEQIGDSHQSNTYGSLIRVQPELTAFFSSEYSNETSTYSGLELVMVALHR